MAKRFEVTLAKCATYFDMESGKSWRRHQTATVDQSIGLRLQSNPNFLVKEVEPAQVAAPAPAPAPKAEAAPLAEEPLEEVSFGKLDKTLGEVSKLGKKPMKKKAVLSE